MTDHTATAALELDYHLRELAEDLEFTQDELDSATEERDRRHLLGVLHDLQAEYDETLAERNDLFTQEFEELTR
ncbi:hypothetical protein ABT332_13550 [Saccharomonospora azurea]|uniref:hypothetical protein n=1 Tax=Saccharomonospora azurea TaxID=40988 RepID=UPI00332A65B2